MINNPNDVEDDSSVRVFIVTRPESFKTIVDRLETNESYLRNKYGIDGYGELVKDVNLKRGLASLEYRAPMVSDALSALPYGSDVYVFGNTKTENIVRGLFQDTIIPSCYERDDVIADSIWLSDLYCKDILDDIDSDNEGEIRLDLISRLMCIGRNAPYGFESLVRDKVARVVDVLTSDGFELNVHHRYDIKNDYFDEHGFEKTEYDPDTISNGIISRYCRFLERLISGLQESIVENSIFPDDDVDTEWFKINDNIVILYSKLNDVINNHSYIDTDRGIRVRALISYIGERRNIQEFRTRNPDEHNVLYHETVRALLMR